MATLVTKTIKASGGDYASLQALAADPQNLVAGDVYWEVTCDNLDDNNGSMPDFSGWTTDSTRYLHIKAATKHASGGVVTTNAYRRTVTGGTATRCVKVGTIGNGGLIIFEGLQFSNTTAGQACIDPVGAVGNRGTIRLVGCILNAAYACTMSNGVNDHHFEMINVIAISSSSIALYGGYQNLKAYHVTVSGTYGIYWSASGGPTITIKNSYARGSTKSLELLGTITKTKVATNDTQGTVGNQNVAYSTANFIGVTAGSENLHAQDDGALAAAGADLSGESAPWNVPKDIDDDTRKASAPYIGADEVPVLGGNAGWLMSF